MSKYHQSENLSLYLGDAVSNLAEMPSDSVNCIVTSPPYFGLRDYGAPGQYGLESSPAEYAETLRKVFSEARRVLADDGTLWLNLGDSHVGGGGYSPNSPSNVAGSKSSTSGGLIGGTISPKRAGVPAKNMLGMPWRVAFGLQDDGWVLRNDIIWEKPNAMPQSVTDRLSSRYEHIFLFSKKGKYHFDLDSIKVPSITEGSKLRNPGDVWRINNKGFSEAHFATFPVELPTRCIKAGCTPGGIVLDPFSGSGATGRAALNLGRSYIGIDISSEYLDMSLRTRLAPPPGGWVR